MGVDKDVRVWMLDEMMCVGLDKGVRVWVLDEVCGRGCEGVGVRCEDERGRG